MLAQHQEYYSSSVQECQHNEMRLHKGVLVVQQIDWSHKEVGHAHFYMHQPGIGRKTFMSVGVNFEMPCRGQWQYWPLKGL